MTDQETAARGTTTNAAIRKELWESRHLLASLRLEIQRGDEAYAALGATLAAERFQHETVVAELARVSAELHATQSAHHAEVQAHAASIADRDERVQAHLSAVAAHSEFSSMHQQTTAQMARTVADYEAILLTRTFRWTHRPRRMWGWLLASRRRRQRL